MITKERLEELIEQETCIFYILNNSVAILRLNDSYGISVEKYNKEYNCKPQFYHSGYVYQDICDADKIFETKEEAEEYLEFGDIVREEKLKIDIPFNEFCELDSLIVMFRIEFTGKDGTSYMLYAFEHKDIILWNKDDDERIVFNKPLTKENYNEVRRLCKRLFLGE